MPNLPRSQSCRCHITTHPEGKNADCCRHIVLRRAGAALGRSRVRRNRRLMSGCQRTREAGMVFVSVVQFIYLTHLFSRPIASFSPFIVRCSSRHFSASADSLFSILCTFGGPKDERELGVLTGQSYLLSLPFRHSRHRRKKVPSRPPSELTPHPHPHPTNLQLPFFLCPGTQFNPDKLHDHYTSL